MSSFDTEHQDMVHDAQMDYYSRKVKSLFFILTSSGRS